MKLLRGTLLLLPFLASGQNTVQSLGLPYKDGLTYIGAPDDAPSIEVHDKLRIYVKRIASPSAVAGAILSAGLSEATNTPGAYGRTWEGYGKRFGTAYARIGIRNTVAFGFDSALHLDPRFFRAPDGYSPGSRALHAALQVLIAHTDSGGRNFAYGSVIGAFAAGQASALWLPHRTDGKVGDGLINAGIQIATNAGRNVFREFLPDIRRKLHHK